MRKKFIVFIALSLLLASSVWVTKQGDKPRTGEKWFNTNIEALADTESGKWQDCYTRFRSDPAYQDIYCGTCAMLPGRASGRSICNNK